MMKKHIVCFGDSNTHGYCADPADTECGGDRFTENERWTCLLEKKLGSDVKVFEEGLSGRTTVFPDALHESMSGLEVIYSTLMCHEPVDLLVVMLGTNDTKDRLCMSPKCIGIGMERLCMKAETIPCWGKGKPNILVIAPPHIGRELNDDAMGEHCAEKSEQLAPQYEEICKAHGWSFLDANGIAEFNKVDFMHLSRKGHGQLSDALAEIIPVLIK